MPLILVPLRRRFGCNFGDIIFERKTIRLIRAQRARIQPNVLVAGLLGRIGIGIAPSKLHGRLGANGGAGKRIGDHVRCRGPAVDVDLHACGAARSIVGEEDVLPAPVDRKSVVSRHFDRDFGRGVLRFRLLRLFLLLLRFLLLGFLFFFLLSGGLFAERSFFVRSCGVG